RPREGPRPARREPGRGRLAVVVIGSSLVHLGQHLARRAAQTVLEHLADRRVLEVDLDAGRAAAHGDARQVRGRVDHARGADAEDQVRRLEACDRARHHRLIEHVAEPHDVGPQVRSARALARRHRAARVGAHRALAVAAHAPQRAVQLDHVAAARARVQAVDVLGDDRRRRLLRLDLGDDAVAGVGLARADRLAPDVVEVPHLLRIALERRLTGVLAIIVLMPGTALSAIGRNTALGRQAGTGEEHDALEAGKSRGYHRAILIYTISTVGR